MLSLLAENIDKEKLEAVFKKLIDRHESLRTSFITVNEEPVQRIHREVDFSIGYYEIMEEADGTNTLIAGFTSRLNLSTAPLLRVNLVTVGSSPAVSFYRYASHYHGRDIAWIFGKRIRGVMCRRRIAGVAVPV